MKDWERNGGLLDETRREHGRRAQGVWRKISEIGVGRQWSEGGGQRTEIGCQISCFHFFTTIGT